MSTITCTKNQLEPKQSCEIEKKGRREHANEQVSDKMKMHALQRMPGTANCFIKIVYFSTFFKQKIRRKLIAIF